MQKFGLFDLIEKFLPHSKAVSDMFTTPQKSDSINENQQKPTPKNNNFAPYLSLIKRHDEISKRIDNHKK